MISVVIPTYNSRAFVGAAIDSVLGQSVGAAEIIVVDDGSTDDTEREVWRYLDRVRYIRQENQGLAGARNTGIRGAREELVCFLDADDEWRPDYVETMLNLARQTPGAVYYCQATCMDVHGRDLPQVVGGPAVATEKMYATLLRANFLIPSTTMVRRSVVMSAGLFDPALRSCEDWDLWLRLAPQHAFVGTNARLVRYRVHGNSLSADPSGMQQAARAVVEKHFGPQDSAIERWSNHKRRAYGGLYRYYALTSVLRKNDWAAAGDYLRQAISADPTVALDLDLFYDLALGNQPPGYRGFDTALELPDNARNLINEVARISPGLSPETRVQLHGTARFGLGLVAYNTGHYSLSRHCLGEAIRYRPDLLRDRRVVGALLKGLFGAPTLRAVRRYRASWPGAAV